MCEHWIRTTTGFVSAAAVRQIDAQPSGPRWVIYLDVGTEDWAECPGEHDTLDDALATLDELIEALTA